MVIDATWFGRDYCLIIYWDCDLKRVQRLRYTKAERFQEIREDLQELKASGVVLMSATTDGGRGVTSALKAEYPNIPHQRCTVHLQRLSLALITQNPRTRAGYEIRPLALLISKIKTKRQKDKWISYFDKWCSKWEEFLKQRSYSDDARTWWYTHKSLRRVRSLITNALPNMFFYLDDENIPKDTNGLEGRFSSFKQHYRQHRGLSKARRETYIVWYIKIVVNKDLPTRY